jgi:AraC family transcriptional regulator
MEKSPNRLKSFEQDASSYDPARFHLMDREIAGFNIVETAHPPNYMIPKHSHEFAYFYIVLHGRFTEFYGTKRRECKPLSFVFTPSGQSHSDTFHDSGGRCFLIEIPHKWMSRIHQCGVVFDNAVAFQGGMLAQLTLKIYKEAYRSDQLSALAIEGLVLEILSELSREYTKEARPPRWLEQANSLIHDCFAEALTLQQIADSVNVHPVYLAAAFRKHYGCTIGAYIRQLRIDYACREIAKPDASLVSIALNAGFSDQSHFSKTFKLLTGMTPTQYREYLANV